MREPKLCCSCFILDFPSSYRIAIILEEHKKGFPLHPSYCYYLSFSLVFGQHGVSRSINRYTTICTHRADSILARSTNTNIVCLSIKLRFTLSSHCAGVEKYGGLWTWIYGLDFFYFPLSHFGVVYLICACHASSRSFFGHIGSIPYLILCNAGGAAGALLVMSLYCQWARRGVRDSIGREISQR